MKAPAKLAAYALVLAIATGGGAAVGAAVGPIDVGGESDGGPSHDDGGPSHGTESDGDTSDTPADPGDDTDHGSDPDSDPVGTPTDPGEHPHDEGR
jgi:hypothetical protein